MNISYVIAGEERIDNALALHKLATVFGMKRVMIGGGGVLNWSFLQDDLVDEVSIVKGPFADGSTDSQGLFTAAEPLSEVEARSFTLIEARPLNNSACCCDTRWTSASRCPPAAPGAVLRLCSDAPVLTRLRREGERYTARRAPINLPPPCSRDAYALCMRCA